MEAADVVGTQLSNFRWAVNTGFITKNCCLKRDELFFGLLVNAAAEFNSTPFYSKRLIRI